MLSLTPNTSSSELVGSCWSVNPFPCRLVENRAAHSSTVITGTVGYQKPHSFGMHYMGFFCCSSGSSGSRFTLLMMFGFS